MQTMTGYEIRQLATDADFAAANELWMLSFGLTPGNAREDYARIFGAFENGHLHAVVAVVDYEMVFGDKRVPCGGIAAVATAPGQRYQSLVRRLLKHALEEMHSRDVPFSSLYPFSYPFYGKMGWAASHWQYKIEADISWLAQIARNGNAKKYRMITNEQIADVLPVYDRWVDRFNLSLVRDSKRLKAAISWPNQRWQAFVHDNGYMLWQMHASTNRVLQVAEFAYLDEAALIDGLALLAQMDSQFDSVAWIDASPEPFLQYGLPDPKVKMTLEPGMMTRVVNIDAFAKLLPVALPVTLADPLGVAGNSGVGEIGVGEIVQLVTGFWEKPQHGRHPGLHRLVGDKKLFCIERF